MEVKFKTDEHNNRYPYVDIGSETHGRPSYRLWISSKLLKKDENGEYYIMFPVKKAKIEKTPKGSLVLRPNDQYIVYDMLVECGYRGESEYTILSPENAEVYPYLEYASERGSLGISEGALINVPNGQPLKYRWERTGRLYGDAPSGVTILTPDGEKKDFEELPDGLEALQELPSVEEEA